MRVILLGLLFIQLNSSPTGVVTGQVLGLDGKPAAGVRVFAIPAGDLQSADRSSLVIETLVQTDTTGHYRLETPTGRYAIAAGSVESPTFFPGTSTLSAATIVSVNEKTTLTDINFSRYIPATSA